MTSRVSLAISLICISSSSWAASPFDGSWAVTETCPPTQTDVRGYTWSYPATIRNGTLSAQYQSPASVGSIRLQGRVAADGDAMLNAAGVVGSSGYAVDHTARGTPYRFHVRARFSESSGSGSRMEQRQCDFAFAKQ